jgi:hypothetical protein
MGFEGPIPWDPDPRKGRGGNVDKTCTLFHCLLNVNVYKRYRYPLYLLKPGLWIQIDFIRIRHFCSFRIRIQNRIRIQAKKNFRRQFLSQIF